MTREQRFVFEFTVSREFLTGSPAAREWINARQAQIAKRPSAIGPRGGLYRLDPAEPLVWRESSDGYDDFMMNRVRVWTKRRGRYVPPSRITPDLRIPSEFVLDSVSLPVQEGWAVLPDGAHVQTSSQFVEVPVPPS